MDCRRVGLIGFTLVLAAAALLHGATAASIVVLDEAGWIIPPNATVYPRWAASKEFKVGDLLVFNFPPGMHDVTKVTKTNYDGCVKTNPISTVTTSPATVNLTATGMHYFICTVGDHCTLGQKLAVNVTANSDTRAPPPATTPPPPPRTTTPSATPPPSTSTTPTPTTTTTSSPPPPPPPSSASSITFSGFSAAILSMVLVFLH